MFKRLGSWLGRTSADEDVPAREEPGHEPPEAERQTDFHQYQVNVGGGTTGHYMSWLRPDEVAILGIPPEGIIAVLADPNGPLAPPNCKGNQPFRLFVHEAIEKLIYDNPTAIEVARKSRDGTVSVPDSRGMFYWDCILDPEKLGRVEHVLLQPEWAIGWFNVSGGAIVPNSYRRNDAYSPIQPAGIVGSIPSPFREEMLTLLKSRHRARGSVT